ncbi:hypothetical protein [Evansella clarkii]|uniref:hypothetical protein n=1 Tax=Evansella clarkii TaxID=79879 RepID=UPI000996E6F7|nr:hypothetical protein [Evansella clarkii]
MKKLIITSLSFCILFMISAITTFADNEYAESSLINFLEAAKDVNVSEMERYVNDERYENEEVLRQNYLENLTANKLIDFKIVDETPLQKEDKYTFTTQLVFENGAVEQVPFDLVLKNEKWLVSIDFDSLTVDEYEILKEGEVEEDIGLRSDTLCSWNFWARAGGSTFYSNCTFSLNRFNPDLNLTVSKQTHNWSGRAAGVNYAVVRNNWYGDTVYGSRHVSGHITSRPSNFTLTVSDTNVSNLKVRFRTDQGFTSSMGYEGSGSLR